MSERQIDLGYVLELPLRETIEPVLRAFEGSGISHEHLAAQIESQVRAYILSCA